MSNIEFSIHPDFIDFVPHPVPAKKMVPSWYKEMSPFIDTKVKMPTTINLDTKEQQVNLTMKACVPIRDALTSGYIIPLPFDIRATYLDVENEKGLLFHFNPQPEAGDLIAKHSIAQIKGSPLEKVSSDATIYKFVNPWRIKTDPGYSVAFYTPPYHNLPFDILPGIVDTDGINEVNFPFIWKNREKEVLMKKGLPMVLALPFKRSEFKSTVKAYDVDKERIRKNAFFSHLGYWYRDFVHKKKKFD